MADVKISGLPASTTPLAGTEVLPIVQSGVTKKVSVADLTTGRAISATSVTASTGNFVVGTSGQGIDFSATAGTGTSELLADYEEGAWTPVIVGTTSAGTATYTSRNSNYTKIGNRVYFQTYTVYTGHTGTGNLTITGLPFTSGGGVYPPASILASGITLTASNTIGGYVNDGTSTILIKQSPVGGGTLADVAMDSAGTFFISGSYTV